MKYHLLSLSLLCLLAVPAIATEKILQNDSLKPMGTVAIQKGFIKGDIGAAVLSAAPGEYPVHILEAQVFFKDSYNSGSPRVYILHIYPRGGINPGTPQYSIAVKLTEGGMNVLDVRAQNLIMNGPFTIGYEVFDLPTPAEPNLCTDVDGCQSGKNLIYDINTRNWYNGCLLGLRGDLIIRAKVDTHFGQAALLSSTSTPRIGSTVILNLDASKDGGLIYQTGSSFSNSGIPIDTRTIPLGLDPLLMVSLFTPAPIFLNYSGKLDTSGKGTALVNLPNLGALVGITLYSAFVTMDSASPSGIKNISNGLGLKMTT